MKQELSKLGSLTTRDNHLSAGIISCKFYCVFIVCIFIESRNGLKSSREGFTVVIANESMSNVKNGSRSPNLLLEYDNPFKKGNTFQQSNFAKNHLSINDSFNDATFSG